jgi:transposase
MSRGDLTNEQCERLRPLLPPQKARRGRPPKDHRPIVNGLLWLNRTAAPWRDLPERYGPWQIVATRYEKRAVNYLAILTIAGITLWL